MWAFSRTRNASSSTWKVLRSTTLGAPSLPCLLSVISLSVKLSAVRVGRRSASATEGIGDQTRAVRVKSWRQRGWDAASIQERQEGTRLIRPEQIRMLGPDVAIALVRDQNPVWLFKARYYEDRALSQLFNGQHTGSALKEPAVMPEAPLPGAVTNERRTDAREPEAVRAERQPALARLAEAAEEQPVGPTGEKPAAKLGVIKGKLGNLKSAVAAHRQAEDARSGLVNSAVSEEV